MQKTPTVRVPNHQEATWQAKKESIRRERFDEESGRECKDT
jgi:hypothetical protein